MELAKITSKEQTTIPKAVRERLDIHAGDLLGFAVEGNPTRRSMRSR